MGGGEKLRERILSLLEESRGYVSGEEIASKLRISRSAVWKHVRALVAQGAEIHSGRKGYLLVSPPDRLFRGRVMRRLRGSFGRELHLHEELGSTSDAAKQLARHGAPEGTVVCAERQSSGRGRLGRRWHSPAGGLWFSIVLRPRLPLHRLNLLSLMLGLGVAEVLEELYGIPAELKWPNDVLAGGRKLCGVLVETEAEPEALRFVVAGVGVNANIAGFPEELQAVSLQQLLGRRVDRCELLAELLNSFEELYALIHVTPEQLIARYRERCATLGKKVRVHMLQEDVEGAAVSIAEDGSLVIETRHGLRRVSSGICTHLD